MADIKITEIFTEEELASAAKLYETTASGSFNHAVIEQIVTPALLRVNEQTGQENDPRYLGYAIEYALHRSKVTGKTAQPS